jgi:hypothetical protein
MSSCELSEWMAFYRLEAAEAPQEPSGTTPSRHQSPEEQMDALMGFFQRNQ